MSNSKIKMIILDLKIKKYNLNSIGILIIKKIKDKEIDQLKNKSKDKEAKKN